YASDHFAILTLGVGPEFDGKIRAVRPPESFVIKMKALLTPKHPTQRTRLARIVAPVRTGMVDKQMHVPAEQFVRVSVAQESRAGGIGKGADALKVDAVDRLGGRFQKQT